MTNYELGRCNGKIQGWDGRRANFRIGTFPSVKKNEKEF
jgi:hypothetical protein